MDVKLVNIAAGSVSLTALLAGDVHLTTDSSSGVVAAAGRGAPIVTVATNGALPYQFVALASIKSPDDLKGKIVGSSRIGAGTDFLLRRILAKIGLTPGKDVYLIPTGVSESDKRIQLMFQGKIDATIGESDKVFQVTESGAQKLTILGEPKDFGVAAPGSEINTTRQAIKELRPRLKAFFMAYSEAIALGRRNASWLIRYSASTCGCRIIPSSWSLPTESNCSRRSRPSPVRGKIPCKRASRTCAAPSPNSRA